MFAVVPFILGTLTQNEMVFKRLHLGTVSYGADTMDEIQSHVRDSYSQVSGFLLYGICFHTHPVPWVHRASCVPICKLAHFSVILTSSYFSRPFQYMNQEIVFDEHFYMSEIVEGIVCLSHLFRLHFTSELFVKSYSVNIVFEEYSVGYYINMFSNSPVFLYNKTFSYF